MRTTRLLVAAAITALAAGGTLAATPAGAAPDSKVLAKGLLSPLSLAVDGPDVYVTQNFGGTLELLRPGKKATKLYAAKGGAEVGAVSARRGTVTFAVSASDAEGNYTSTKLMRIADSGKARTVADLLAYEKKRNPDGKVTYGVRGISPACAAAWPTEEAPPASYPGVVDSHPYATYSTAKTTYVADAAMNAVLSVSPKGKVKTVAVLPAVPTEITAPFAESLGLPECAVGLDYYFEAVPTDVELGPDGKLYVTALPGGPEDPSLGARGVLFKVNPKTGKATKVAAGLVSPVGVAVAGNGDAYVSQLFSGAIAKIKKGSSKAKTVRRLSMTGDVEIQGKDLFVSTDVLPPEGKAPNGKVVRFRR